MNELDDFLCEQQIDELPDYYECLWDLAAQDYYESPSESAQRRKNEWKFAKRRYKLLCAKNGTNFVMKYHKPVHFYAKNAPEVYYQRTNKTNNKGKHRTAYGNYNPSKNWSVADKRKIQTGENQMKELFDNE